MNYEVGGSWHFFSIFEWLRPFFREILLGEKGIFWKFQKLRGSSPPLPLPMVALTFDDTFDDVLLTLLDEHTLKGRSFDEYVVSDVMIPKQTIFFRNAWKHFWGWEQLPWPVSIPWRISSENDGSYEGSWCWTCSGEKNKVKVLYSVSMGKGHLVPPSASVGVDSDWSLVCVERARKSHFARLSEAMIIRLTYCPMLFDDYGWTSPPSAWPEVTSIIDQAFKDYLLEKDCFSLLRSIK